MTIFAIPKREFSSAGSEHLPYKQRVGGSNPSTPTKIKREIDKGQSLSFTCTNLLHQQLIGEGFESGSVGVLE